MNKPIRLSAIVLGFTAMASQILFIRELIIVFYGFELSIGLMLASWLIGGALGSAVIGRFSDIIRHKTKTFSSLLFLLGLLIPANIIIIRSLRQLAGINPGELVPLSLMMTASFFILVPICAILGFLFSLACSMYKVSSPNPAEGIGRIYVTEALGAMLGGLLVSIVFVRVFDSVYTAMVIGFIDMTAASFLLISSSVSLNRRKITAAVLVVLSLWLVSWPAGLWQRLTDFSISQQWKGCNVAASGNSIYGNIVLVKQSDQYSFFDNGLRLYTIPDRQTAEEAVHYPMLEHPDPKEVLLIGGGLGGMLTEIMRHGVKTCDYVELDPLIIEMALAGLSPKYTAVLDDPRISISIEDGRYYVKNSKKTYDVVIVNIGDPFTAMINRYYTVEFFKEVKGILKEGGVLSFALSSSENYINAELRDFLRSIHTTLKKVFAQVNIIPGDTAYFIASDSASALTYDYEELMKRASARALDIKYVREYYLFSKLSKERVRYIEQVVSKEGMENLDFRPIAYILETLFWSSRFRGSPLQDLFAKVTPRRIRITVFCVCAFILLFGVFMSKKKRAFEKSVLISVLALGFTGMAIQMILLLSFQAIYGYLFYRIGIILTCFMAGLALGGWISTILLRRTDTGRTIFIKIQAILTAFVFAMPLLLGYLASRSDCMTRFIGSNIIFPYLSMVAGFISGFQFPIASKIYLGSGASGTGASAGINYGLDLAGACLGAVFAGAVLLPFLGLSAACSSLAVINLSCVLALIFLSSR